MLHGMRGSPGVARGTARVLRSLGEADRLEAGDVLVAETTAPPWTPLFGRAVAIVTDAGGILSHCAVVAREYEIPAVVGTKMGRSVIRDGQEIEVDGTNGTVRISGEVIPAGRGSTERAMITHGRAGTILAPLNSTMIAVALPRIIDDFGRQRPRRRAGS